MKQNKKDQLIWSRTFKNINWYEAERFKKFSWFEAKRLKQFSWYEAEGSEAVSGPMPTAELLRTSTLTSPHLRPCSQKRSEIKNLLSSPFFSSTSLNSLSFGFFQPAKKTSVIAFQSVLSERRANGRGGPFRRKSLLWFDFNNMLSSAAQSSASRLAVTELPSAVRGVKLRLLSCPLAFYM